MHAPAAERVVRPMRLVTANEVRAAPLPTRLVGYDYAETDDLLERCALSIQTLWRVNRDLSKQIEQLKQQLNERNNNGQHSREDQYGGVRRQGAPGA